MTHVALAGEKHPDPAGLPYGTLCDHVVSIDSDGTLMTKNGDHPPPDLIVRHILDRVAQSKKKRIALYIHGGRVTMGQALKTAQSVGPLIYEDCEEGAYPIFICWETGDLSTYKDHLLYKRSGISYRHTPAGRLSALTAPLQLGADLGRGVSRLPVNTIANYGKLLQNSDLLPVSTKWMFPVRQQYQNNLAQYYLPSGVEVQQAIKKGFIYPDRYAPDKIQISVGADADHYQLKFFVHQAMTLPLQIASEGLLDSAGTSEWSNMVGRTHNMFYAPRAYLPQDHPPQGQPGVRSDGAATVFFRELRSFLSHHDVGLDIYAHSMGSMVTNEAFARFPDLRVSHIVFMSAACSIRQFANTTALHIKQYKTPFYNLSLHPRAELDEVEAFGVPVRGSLLTWIDEFFESPPSFGDRTLGTFENVIIAHNQLPQCSSVHLKAFGIENGRGRHDCYAGPQKHGEYKDYYFWHRDFWLPQPPDKRYHKIPHHTTEPNVVCNGDEQPVLHAR